MRLQMDKPNKPIMYKYELPYFKKCYSNIINKIITLQNTINDLEMIDDPEVKAHIPSYKHQLKELKKCRKAYKKLMYVLR